MERVRKCLIHVDTVFGYNTMKRVRKQFMHVHIWI